jgi:Tfp pilus assembly protein PilF
MKLRFFPGIDLRLLLMALVGFVFLPLHAAGQPAGESAGQTQQSQPGPDSRVPMSAKDLQIQKAGIYMAEKKYDAAILTYQEVLKTDPKNAVVLNMTGIAYLNLTNFDQAKKYFERSSKADKKYSSAVNNLGMVWYHQKNFRRAILRHASAAVLSPVNRSQDVGILWWPIAWSG